MAAGPALELLLFSAGAALLAIGVTAALASGNVVKRLVGLFIALIAAALGALALGAPQSVTLGAIALAIASLLLGGAIAVRLQEDYHALDAAEIDAADMLSEPGE